VTGQPIALFVPSLRFGGAERVAVNLAGGLAALGAATDLVVVSSEGEFAEHIPPGVRLVDLGASRVAFGLPRLAAYIRRERPVAIISFMDHAGIIALCARRLSRVPTRLICTVHSHMSQATLNSSNRRSRLLPALVRAFYPSADAIVAVSQGVASDMSEATGLPPSMVRVIYNPVITPELLAAARLTPGHPWLTDGGPPVVLGAGRLTQAKDFGTLIRAFALVRRQRPARLLILGEGELRPALEALVRELGITADVALPGFVAGAVACMAHASVFVLSSAWEGLPTVLIEAMAVGTPVVATDCRSGPREILRSGELGRLVPPGDFEALAEGILAVLAGSAPRVSPTDLREFTLEVASETYRNLALTGSR
jgi:glycosyltransferase involved in cell wall biosynthesis